MKELCALFKQRGLTINEKKDNVCLLMEASKLSHHSTSTMEDEELAIRSFASNPPTNDSASSTSVDPVRATSLETDSPGERESAGGQSEPAAPLQAVGY